MLDYLTLPEIINELRSLTKSSASGVFFIVTDEKHSASFGFEKGRIIAIQYRVRTGEGALPLIAQIKRGSCRFETYSKSSEKNSSMLPDNETIFLSILSANPQPDSKSPNQLSTFSGVMKKTVRNQFESGLSLKQQAAMEHILVEELGPIGSVVMESVGRCSSLNDMLSVIEEYLDRPEIIKSIATKLRNIL